MAIYGHARRAWANYLRKRITGHAQAFATAQPIYDLVYI